MDIFKIHNGIVQDYKTYIESFIRIKDKKIKVVVEKNLKSKNLLPDPLIQFNPSFQKSKSISDLVNKNIIHKDIEKIFMDSQNNTFRLYQHQVEAIELGIKKIDFIVTSGTGSGKSLTYLASIFNHLLKSQKREKGIKAIIVYPMNALINSQLEEITKYQKGYEKITGLKFPISFERYTGQENSDKREEIKKNLPDIILTNYMMLELLMTRLGESQLRNSIAENLEFLVFDELHTYRGRQGADVAMLIRRIKAHCSQKICCIGTSATMLSDKNATFIDQQNKVAKVGSKMFGGKIYSNQIIFEKLTPSLVFRNINKESIKAQIKNTFQNTKTSADFEQNSLAVWLENEIAIEAKEGNYVRKKPITLTQIIKKLESYSGESYENCENELIKLLKWANSLKGGKSYLPFKIHQFIAQTGSVYVTLDSPQKRKITLEAGVFIKDEEKNDRPIFPIVFSRNSGHEFICVKLSQENQILEPRNFQDKIQEEGQVFDKGYIFIEYENQEPIWNPDEHLQQLPDSWLKIKNSEISISKKYQKRAPRKIYFDNSGNFSFENKLISEGWFMPAPLLFDPTSGTIFPPQTSENTKLMRLGSEGRSTATTVLSYSVLQQLAKAGISPYDQKLLSFTDNRQDASLQSGHFNDFIKSGEFRAAIFKALQNAPNNELDYSNIANQVFNELNISQEEFALSPKDFPGPKSENENAFKDFILYRLIWDLRRSWRVIMPNLEQCGLLEISYKYLKENSQENKYWKDIPLLERMSIEEREDFIRQILDYFRTSYAIYLNDYLDSNTSVISQKTKQIKDKVKAEYGLDTDEKIDSPYFLRVETLEKTRRNLFLASIGSQSNLGKFIKSKAKTYDIILNNEEYKKLLYKFLDLLEEMGLLRSIKVKNEKKEEVSIYQLQINQILWRKGNLKNVYEDKIRTRSFKENQGTQKINKFFQDFYLQDFGKKKKIKGNEHTGQIGNEDRQIREDEFRKGDLSVLFCSPTMELGIDIKDLSIVHMRNVPPTSANYAQRSGRAGRSGQAALVFTFCSNYSPHDRYYFENSAEMVAGSVSPPRIDLINEELLQTHLHSLYISKKGLRVLDNSLAELIDINDLKNLPLKDEVLESLKLNESEKIEIIKTFNKVLNDDYLFKELREQSWFSNSWTKLNVEKAPELFNEKLDRWRRLFRAAQNQILNATAILENAVFGKDSEERKNAFIDQRQGIRQRDLLKNESYGNASQLSEFYPYRYFASEGFLPGYNFTRLPLRIFVENSKSGGEFISRGRFLALREFGPNNLIYHNGSKFRINQLILSEAENKLTKVKISKNSSLLMEGIDYEKEVDPILQTKLDNDSNRDFLFNILEMSETRAIQTERISCAEEERTSQGFDIQTYFSIPGGMDKTTESHILSNGDKLLNIHLIQPAKIYHLNNKWRAGKEEGFALDLRTGFWQSKKQEENPEKKDTIKRVKLITSDTSNALYIQPVKALALTTSGVITLQYALKRAIESVFQVESNEIGVVLMGDKEQPNIFIYEASEGSLGILSQLIFEVDNFKRIIKQAYEICFYENNNEVEDINKLLPATYKDLLSYYNQRHHKEIDRRLIKDALQKLMDCQIEIVSNKAFANYEEQYEQLQNARDPNSQTEDKFLKYLYKNNIKLPDLAQPKIPNLFVRPDFLYKPNIVIFCDGTPHDKTEIKKDDKNKRQVLKDNGFQVLTWNYKDSLESFVKSRPDIFKIVRN
ncbi:MAG: DUF1998 domain-containing protein [Calditrichaeota bacterium]|nr:MAG: DUF1998 domain-containing protein [Calditrichota bacterium]